MRSRFRTPPPEASYQRQADVPRLGRVYVATPGVGPRVLSARALVSRSASVRPSRLSRSPKPERAATVVWTTAFTFSARDGSLSGCHVFDHAVEVDGTIPFADGHQRSRLAMSDFWSLAS